MASTYDYGGTGIGGVTKRGSLFNQDERGRVWGKLSGYSWDTLKDRGTYLSTDGSVLNMPEWRAESYYAKTWMNDGTMSEDMKSRKLAPWVKFDRFYSIDLEREVPSGRHYIFMLRPDLYLTEPYNGQDAFELSAESRVKEDPYFNYLQGHHPEIVSSLCADFAGMSKTGSYSDVNAATSSGKGNATWSNGAILNGKTLPIHTFIPYITSRIESLQLPDFVEKSSQIVQPYTKYSIPYAQSAIESVTGGTFDITFRDDRYYSIHKLFYAWVYYQDRVMRNIFQPKKKYLQYNSIDYATSIYDFIVDDTGENVVYWAKYTGCIPTSVPMSDLGFNKGSPAESRVSIGFSYFFCEHMDMNVLRDFQYNSLGYEFMKGLSNQLEPCTLDQTVPIFDDRTFLGTHLVGRPILISAGNEIKLRWLSA